MHLPGWPFKRRSQTLEPAVFRPAAGPTPARPWNFISLRWKAIPPLLIVVLVVVMAGAYLVGDSVAANLRDETLNRLLIDAATVSSRMNGLGTIHEREVTRIAYTLGVAEAAQAGDGMTLHALLEPLAAAADLDYVWIADTTGREIIGLQRVITESGGSDYAVASGSDLSSLVAQGGISVHHALTRTPQGHALITAGPLLRDSAPVGVVLVGTRAERVLAALQSGDDIDLALFGGQAEFVRTTLPATDSTLAALRLSPEAFDQALSTPGQVPVENLKLEGRPTYAAYVPLEIGGSAVGVLGVYEPDESLAATFDSRQLLAGLAAALAGLLVLVAYGIMARFAGRLERITHTAAALSGGDTHARTGMKPHDEIGQLGATLDRLADHSQRHTEALRRSLRQQRQETAHLNAVLESIPDGVVVQDLDGRVLLINDAARELLGGQRMFRTARLHELTAVVTEALGPALAPGIYALGDPTRIPLQGRMLQAQAAAILTQKKTRIGTVIVLRDITRVVEREQARERLLERLSEQASAPTAPQTYTSLAALAKEVAHNARSIQRVIAELRDLSTFEPRDLQAGQRALALNDLLWNIAAEWQPLARNAHIRLDVRFAPHGLHILGDDRRLRWAVGNLIDNALKYSPPHTVILLDGTLPDDDSGQATIAVIDQGYGMSETDLSRAFTRFYRGSPRDFDGKPVRQPGTGQGLFIAQRVIEAHGGQITLDSHPGDGTTATIRLPLTAPVTLEMPAAEATLETLDGQDDEAALSQGTPFDTVPLEPHRSRRRR